MNTLALRQYGQATYTKLKQHYDYKYKGILSPEQLEQRRLDTLDLTGMTLDQLRTEHHVVTQRIDRKLYKAEGKADLIERQDKLLLTIKKLERRGK